jgi:signal transduction histidine kinase
MHIRTRLLLLALSILLPAFLATVMATWLVYTEQQANQEKISHEAVKSFAKLVDMNFMAVEGKLQTLAGSPDLAEGNLDAFSRHASALLPKKERVIVLSTVEGQQLLNTRAPPSSPLPRTNSSLLQLRLQNPDRTVVSDLFVGGVAKKKDIAVDVPVRIGGLTRYRLAMGFPASELQDLIDSQQLPKGWIATIVDRNGVIVARNDQPGQYVGKRATAAMLQRILAKERSGINQGLSLDGREVMAFFYRAPLSDWTAVLSIPQAEIRKPALSAAAYSAGILLGMLGIAAWAAHAYARRTAGPIEALRHAAELLGRGEPVTIEKTGLVEADSIGQALAAASTQVRQHHRELEVRVTEAVSASELAQRALMQAQKLEALGRLTGGVAHDFNNILQTLSSCLQLLRMGPAPARTASILDTGDKAIRRATDLTAQMRSFARVQDVRLETFELHEAINTVMPLLTSSLQSNVTLRIEHAAQACAVTADRLQLELALLNVVINARDAMPRGGEIVIRLDSTVLTAGELGIGPGDFTVLSVSDQGTGIPAELLEKVLDPFFTTKPVDRGTGLGLPQAYGFATQAKGTLVLDSVEGKGTTVRIYLPLATNPVQASSIHGAAAGRSASGAGTILFVEDDPLVRETVALALEHAGFDVLPAVSGDAALALLDAGAHADFVFSDVVMPGTVNGIELARLVLQRFPAMRVVLASGHSDMAIDLPQVKLIGKPYDVVSVVNLLVQPHASA